MIEIENFCKENNLGTVFNITKILGGRMHKMFKVETSKGIYAIKILNPEVMKRKNAYDNFILSEKIPNLAKENNIPVASALEINGEYLIKYKDMYYMVFDYIDGKVLKDEEITINHCRKIGKILSKIHNIDYQKLNIEEKTVEDHFFVDWENYIHHPNFENMNYKELYLKNYKKYYSLLKRTVERLNASNQKQTICHKDMDPKNVMWKDDEPIIIDWESASLSNPYRELIEVALSWSGFLSNQFSEEKFTAIIEEYIKTNQVEHHRYDIICGNLIGRFGWLDYNLKRSLGLKSDDREEMALAENEVTKTIEEINRYLELIGTMYQIICDLTKPESNDYDTIVERIIKSNDLLTGLSYSRINAGFTNTIYLVQDYIVRICTDLKNEKRFKNEIDFYNRNKNNDKIPKLYFSDVSKNIVPYYYEIMEKVEGQTLYEVWYKLSNIKRENIVLKIIDILRTFHSIKVDSYDFNSWIKNKISNLTSECNLNDKLVNKLLSKCDIYFKENKFGIVHGDLHFDNFIYRDEKLKLLDFERSMIYPIDYDFKIWDKCKESPWLWASAKTDMLTVEDDYQELMQMFLDNYQELREIPYLKERLTVYRIIDDLKSYKNTRKQEQLKLIEDKIISIS